ncbi:MAG TPA: hypothetical protein VHP83_01025 [Aggregatilineaceae bacterium]|nr:hypothetical protein [Aggregatilineaceae bacterium]
MRKLRLSYTLLLLLMLLVSCQSDDNPADPKPTLTPAATADPFTLTETYTSPAGISFQHPAGWIMRYQTGYITAANQVEAFNVESAQPGQVAFMLMEPSLAAVNGGATPAEILTLYAAQETQMTFGSIKSATVGDKNAARASIKQATLEGFALAIEMEPDTNVLLIALAAPGELAAFEPLLLDIAATIQYEPAN